MEIETGEFLLILSARDRESPDLRPNLIISDMKVMGMAPIRAYGTLEEATEARDRMIRDMYYDVAVVEVKSVKRQK